MKITMCEKEYYFKLKNNNVCVLYIPTTNSKLEKFVQKQHSLWHLTGSSLGALKELIAVAGIGNIFLFIMMVDLMILYSSLTVSINCSMHVAFVTWLESLAKTWLL
jgi:hypothetical protein